MTAELLRSGFGESLFASIRLFQLSYSKYKTAGQYLSILYLPIVSRRPLTNHFVPSQYVGKFTVSRVVANKVRV
jgi:hypothetical protein